MSKNTCTQAGFYEFFAGGGMARAGLARNWCCLFANDIDPKKAAAYKLNWGDEELEVGDIGSLSTGDLPGRARLAWASFPCQDLSLAGMGAGLKGLRSGSFWPFWKLIQGLKQEGRAPGIIVLENVCGALTSHGGQDFRTLIGALADEGYKYGALIIDAVYFVPQSRPRLFIVAVEKDTQIPTSLLSSTPDEPWTSTALTKAWASLTQVHQRDWLWWSLPPAAVRKNVFSDLLEEEPKGVRWHTTAETKRLLELMSPLNHKKLEVAKAAGKLIIGAVYKRTRLAKSGERKQRAEIRFDDIAGCLRTPLGGSSRQTILVVEGEKVRSRLLSPREAARLMGLPEEYVLPGNYNEAYHITGDGLVVPVVRHLSTHLLEPLLHAAETQRHAA